jgi:hypothetical protein
MSTLSTLAPGALALIAVIITWYVARHGGAWVIGKLKTWWTAGKADLAILKADVSSLKTDVVALGKQVGVTTITAPPGPPAAPAAAKPAEAAAAPAAPGA